MILLSPIRSAHVIICLQGFCHIAVLSIRNHILGFPSLSYHIIHPAHALYTPTCTPLPSPPTCIPTCISAAPYTNVLHHAIVMFCLLLWFVIEFTSSIMYVRRGLLIVVIHPSSFILHPLSFILHLLSIASVSMDQYNPVEYPQ